MKKMIIALTVLASLSAFADEAMKTESTKTDTVATKKHGKMTKKAKKETKTETKTEAPAAPAAEAPKTN